MCNQKTYRMMREESDNLCKEYDMSVIENPISKRRARYLALLQLERRGKYTGYAIIKQDIDLAVSASPKSFEEFTKVMEQLGYRLERRGKDLRIIPYFGKRKPYRLRTLGAGYSEWEIEARIKEQWWNPQEYSFKIYNPQKRVPTSLYGLYVHYCFLLGIFPKERPMNTTACECLKEDKLRVQKFSEEADLMGKNGIETMGQLTEHYLLVTSELEKKLHERKTFRYALRRMTDETEIAEVKSKIKTLTADIRRLRREKDLCQDITYRSAGVEEVVRLKELR